MTRAEMLKRLEAVENPLALSIEKWEDILAYKGASEGAENCALCEKHMDSDYGQLFCSECPVAQYTGRQLCEKTPYRQWITHHRKAHPKAQEYIRVNGCRWCSRLIRAELAFLKSLREGDKWQSRVMS